MKLFCLITIICQFFIFNINAQAIICDSRDRSPIPFVNVFSSNGVIIGTTDMNGIIQIKHNEYKNSDSVVLEHMSYDKIEIPTIRIDKFDTIFLTPKIVSLPEVNINSIGENPVLILKAYFRSYELDNDVPKYYTDGIVEYYVPNKRRKKIKIKILENRSFINKKLIENEKERTFTVVMQLAGIPRINLYNIQNVVYDKDYQIEEGLNNTTNIKKDTLEVGMIKANEVDKQIQLYVDFAIPTTSKTLFGYTSKILKNEVTQNYSGKELSDIRFKNLINQFSYSNIKFKHKKDTGFIDLKGINQLFILKLSYGSKRDYRKLKSSSYGFPNKSEFTYKYWKKFEDSKIPKLNRKIASGIKNFLVQVK